MNLTCSELSMCMPKFECIWQTIVFDSLKLNIVYSPISLTNHRLRAFNTIIPMDLDKDLCKLTKQSNVCFESKNLMNVKSGQISENPIRDIDCSDSQNSIKNLVEDMFLGGEEGKKPNPIKCRMKKSAELSKTPPFNRNSETCTSATVASTVAPNRSFGFVTVYVPIF